MKKILLHTTPSICSLLLAVAFCIGTTLFPTAGYGGEQYTATMQIQGNLMVGHPVIAVYDLGGYEIPASIYTSINVSVIEQPAGEKPTIRPGYPSTSIIFHQPGTYTLNFQISEVSKSSCGGVDAHTLLDTRQTIEIQPAVNE